MTNCNEQEAQVDLRVALGPLTLSNPVMPASGTFGVESLGFLAGDLPGAIVPKSITLHPQEGNPPPRIVEEVGGMINSIGIPNKGLYHFMEELLPQYITCRVPIIVSISDYDIEHFRRMTEVLHKNPHVEGIEINISCPNLKAGGHQFGMREEDTFDIVTAVRKETDKLVYPKLTPNVGNMVPIALAASEAGADAVCLTNTYAAMAIDIEQQQPVLGNVTGGLSGPCIKPISLYHVYQVAQKVTIPVIGVGGIGTWQDAAAFLLAGASAVQVGTGSFREPDCMADIISGLRSYFVAHHMEKLSDCVGKALPGKALPGKSHPRKSLDA